MPSLQAGAAYVPLQVINPSTNQTAGGSGRVDSGADITLIDANVLAYINATPTGNMIVVGIDGQDQNLTEYIVTLNFGQYGYIPQIKVVGLPNLQSGQGIQALIGKDVLSTGFFDDDGLNGTFTFQVGIGQGPPINPIPSYVIPLAVTGIALGFAGLLWMWTR